MAILPQPLITPVTNGADISITAKTWTRGVSIAEDASGSAAGLKITFPNGNFIELAPAKQPLVLGVVPPVNGSPFIGQPATSVGGGGNAATVYCKVRSMGADTVVAVLEYN